MSLATIPSQPDVRAMAAQLRTDIRGQPAEDMSRQIEFLALLARPLMSVAGTKP